MAGLDKKIPAEALEGIVIDSGIVIKNFEEENQSIIGITRGGSTFNVEPEWKNVERDGNRGPEKGLRRLINLVATLSVNMMDLNGENIKDAVAVADVDGDEVNPKLTLEDSDYLDNITIVGEKLGGGFIQISLKNALSTEGIEINFEDKEESVVETTFTAHFDPKASEGDYENLFKIKHLDQPPNLD